MKKIPALLFLILILAKEFLISSFSIAYAILFIPSKRISPKLAVFDTSGMHRSEIILLAQMVTLTPGTIAVEIQSDKLLIHIFDGSKADETLSQIRTVLLKALYGVTR